jgi:hypothetical protein
MPAVSMRLPAAVPRLSGSSPFPAYKFTYSSKKIAYLILDLLGYHSNINSTDVYTPGTRSNSMLECGRLLQLHARAMSILPRVGPSTLRECTHTVHRVCAVCATTL